MTLLCLEDLVGSVNELRSETKELQDLLSKQEYNAVAIYFIKETARKICVCSRYVHKNIWVSQPENTKVNPPILDALKKSREVVNSIDKKRIEDKETVECITELDKNISHRIKNIEDNYLTGKPSKFKPDKKHFS